MDFLWSPWRYQYVSRADKIQGCIFCDKPAQGRDAENFIVYRGTKNYVILNQFPYNSGHVMVVPYRHVADLEGLPDEELADLAFLARKTTRILRRIYKPEGFNIGFNLGKCAGAGIAGHIHLHIVPRWTGDTNYMTVIGETRVLPEDLRTTFSKLSEAFKAEGF